ncbi:uncharacterized protein LOC117134915 [Drosophila busckii]|uniref:uncharacterized protein LOC117134915 n=1 Tax=Drosophila busckii TaxID=30019 RepID=UPI001432B31C|nr:uncharacterized protein LOC117134915 [Drosophila busckii]
MKFETETEAERASRNWETSHRLFAGVGIGIGVGVTALSEFLTSHRSSSSRRSSNIKSLLMLAILMCQLQQLLRPSSGGGGCSGGVALAAPAPTHSRTHTHTHTDELLHELVHIGSSSAHSRRLHKRHDDNKAAFYRELNSSVLDWSNTCTGTWEEQNRPTVRPHKRCAEHKKLIKFLISNITTGMSELSSKDANISELLLFRSQYKFLPQLKARAKPLRLRRLHNELQMYVASFSYIYVAQQHWEYENQQKTSELSMELLRFRRNARWVLCSVEEAINATNGLYGKQQPRLKTVPRALMERHLSHFTTPLVQLHGNATLAARNQTYVHSHQINHIRQDAQFLQHHYLKYLKRMTRLLAKQSRRSCKRQANAKVSSSSSSSSKTSKLPRPAKRQRQRPRPHAKTLPQQTS